VRCAVAVAPLRAEPAEDAEQVTQVLLGEPLRVAGRDGAWAWVVTAYDYPGWLRAEALEEGEGGFPAPEGRSPLELARTYLGSPYLWGGMTAAGIDCSGLIHMAYRRSGRLVPRDAWQQAQAGTPVAAPEAGDLVFYADPGRQVDHGAFWAGEGRILHATGRDGLGVVEEDEPPSLAERRILAVRL
jgi:gamma-D-glutamyl-L-lysine dipeptidyl-peptidase